ncbi:unnamed protein product, partial [Hymenolepis diminuta]
MTDFTLTYEMTRHAVIASTKVRQRSSKIATFLKVATSFVWKVGREVLNENNEGELIATRKRTPSLSTLSLTHSLTHSL